MAGPGDDPDEGRRARPGDGRPGRQPGDRRPQAARARGLPLRGRRRLARAADAPGRRVGARLLPRREHAGDHRRAAAAATFTTEATVKVWVGDDRHVCTAEGNGPVNAIDTALRAALQRRLPAARPGPPHRLQGAHPRRRPARPAPSPGCCSTPTDGERDWTTIGVSPNIIEASWRALEESLVYGLLHASTAAPA